MGPWGRPSKGPHTAWKSSGGGAEAQPASRVPADAKALWAMVCPCRCRFANLARLGTTSDNVTASRQFFPRCSAHKTHPKQTPSLAERR
eukprot:4083165-Lingulodinium_polyedra.AAC.1